MLYQARNINWSVFCITFAVLGCVTWADPAGHCPLPWFSWSSLRPMSLSGLGLAKPWPRCRAWRVSWSWSRDLWGRQIHWGWLRRLKQSTYLLRNNLLAIINLLISSWGVYSFLSIPQATGKGKGRYLLSQCPCDAEKCLPNHLPSLGMLKKGLVCLLLTQ